VDPNNTEHIDPAPDEEAACSVDGTNDIRCMLSYVCLQEHRDLAHGIHPPHHLDIVRIASFA